MKRIMPIFATLFFLNLLAPIAQAAEVGNWSGWITDDACGKQGRDDKEKGAAAIHKKCVDKCLAKGAKLVLYNMDDKKLYDLDRQDLAKEHLGHPVTISGKVTGDKIAVSSIELKKGK